MRTNGGGLCAPAVDNTLIGVNPMVVFIARGGCADIFRSGGSDKNVIVTRTITLLTNLQEISWRCKHITLRKFTKF